MNDRYTADTINSDALDQLYDQLDRVRALHHPTGVVAAAEHGNPPGCAVCGPFCWPCPTYQAVDTPGPAATQAAEPEDEWTGSLIPAPLAEAIRQMDADTTDPHTGLVVQPYRDHGEQKWVFRCWGTDTCDGWLSLDHYSEQSAERARDRHAAEEHGAPGPAATDEQDLVHALGGDRTAQTIAHTLTVHGHTLNAVRTMTYAELLAVPGIGGTSLARIRAALDGVPEPDAAATTDPAGEYERTTGHAITCTAGFTDTCTCPPKEQH